MSLNYSLTNIYSTEQPLSITKITSHPEQHQLAISLTGGTLMTDRNEHYDQAFVLSLPSNLAVNLQIETQNYWLLAIPAKYLENLLLTLPISGLSYQNPSVLEISPEKLEDISQILNLLNSPQRSNQHETGSALLLKFLLLQLVPKTAPQPQFKSNSFMAKKAALSFKQMVADSIHTKLSVRECAKKLYISHPKLHQICKDYYRLSPKQIIIQERIKAMKKELISTEQTVYQIAELFCFEDASNFSKFFIKYTKMLPTEYREQQRWLNERNTP